MAQIIEETVGNCLILGPLEFFPDFLQPKLLHFAGDFLLIEERRYISDILYEFASLLLAVEDEDHDAVGTSLPDIHQP